MKTFKVESGKLVITDPCYTLPTWCQGIVENVKNGVWTVGAEYDGNRVKSLHCYNNEAYTNSPNILEQVYNAPEMPFVVGVDSGQAGFFDHAFYRDDNSLGDSPLDQDMLDHSGAEEPGAKFYAACCHLTYDDKADIMHKFQFGTIPYGAVSSSGYGDGSYTCKGLFDPITGAEYVAFVIIFLENDEPFDEDDNLEEEETD